MVHTAVSKEAVDRNAEALALWRGVVGQLGGAGANRGLGAPPASGSRGPYLTEAAHP